MKSQKKTYTCTRTYWLDGTTIFSIWDNKRSKYFKMTSFLCQILPHTLPGQISSMDDQIHLATVDINSFNTKIYMGNSIHVTPKCHFDICIYYHAAKEWLFHLYAIWPRNSQLSDYSLQSSMFYCHLS